VDAKASLYSASIRLQEARTEIIADLGNMVKEGLRTFYQTCGQKPVKILFYRDGMSEGEFTKVLDKELKAIRGTIIVILDLFMLFIKFI
jgi:Piwi domain